MKEIKRQKLELDLLAHATRGHDNDVLHRVTADDFSVADHRKAFNIIQNRKQHGKSCDLFDMQTDFDAEGAKDIFLEIQMNTLRAPLEECLRDIEKVRLWHNYKLGLADLMQAKSSEQIERLHDFMNDMYDRIKQIDTAPLRSMAEDLESICSYHVEALKVGHTFHVLNDNHHLIRRGFITIGGDASDGKSSLMTALVNEVLENEPDIGCLYYTLDDSYHMTGKRILSQMMGINLIIEPPIDSKMITEDQKKIFHKIIGKEQAEPFNIIYDARAAKKYLKCNKIIIAIDYLQIINNDGNLDTRIFFNNVVKSLKEVQKTLEPEGGCAVLLASQLSREKTKVDNYRETSEIINQSDVCLNITRDPDDPDSGKRLIVCIKNKTGQRGMIFRTSIGVGYKFSVLTDGNEQYNILSKVFAVEPEEQKDSMDLLAWK